MKVLILSIVTAAIVLPQAKGPTTQEAKDCAQNFAGNNNTGTVTCYGVDKKLAEQIGQLVAASKRDGKTLKDISDKVAELLKLFQYQAPASGTISQGNSGGINIQQGTTGNNSPIINSPITVGDMPRMIQPNDKAKLINFLRGAPNKIKVQISADQVSGAVPFPDDFYDVLKDGGWTMVDAGVNHYLGFASPGRPFQGVIVSIKGEPLKPNESVGLDLTDPLSYIGRMLEALRVPRNLKRDPGMADGLITINFEGGFPR